jgi:hypothetical protein
MTKRARLKKLASLSALGAGAVALTGTNADAGIISDVLDGKVGFDPANGFGQSFQFHLPGIPQTLLSFHTYTKINVAPTFQSFTRGLKIQATNGARFAGRSVYLTGPRVTIRYFTPFSAGYTFASYRPAFTSTRFGRYWSAWQTAYGSGTSASYFGLSSPFTDKFLLFKFGDASNPNYGWLELSYSFSNVFGPDPAAGPNLSITAYGYETDPGVQIAAGALGSAPAPEPGTAELGGLAALALGAEALRRWRKTRKAA